jgi:hypothetical protein
MSDEHLNDNHPATEGRAQAFAALFLVESLLHALVAKQVLTVGEAVETVDSAAEVSVLVVEEGGAELLRYPTSMDSLQAIKRSLIGDL